MNEPAVQYRVFRLVYERGYPEKCYFVCDGKTSNDIAEAFVFRSKTVAIRTANRLSGGWQVEEVQGVAA